jgi:hypothetical protein
MNVPILVCGCGMRVKAPGAKPGRVGRCPACGGRLEVPTLPKELEAPIGLADESEGFGRRSEIVLTPTRAAPVEPEERPRPRAESERPGWRPPMADGLLPLLQKPEREWTTSFLYPLRGAESMAMVGAFGVIAWMFTVPFAEYCLQVMAETEKAGAGLLGLLYTWIVSVPGLILGPFFLAYWLQYLGRVLVTSARGDCAPPRMPDRNFDGFFTGLSPWFIWVVLGVGVGLIPALAYAFAGVPAIGGGAWLALALAVAALPYILAALMLSFLHDNEFAAVPWGVLLSLVRLGVPFLLLSGLIAAALGVAGGCIALAVVLRSHAFWVYLPIALVCWIAVLWVQLVIMRLLGLYYFHHQDNLHWHRAHPRWGVAWRL